MEIEQFCVAAKANCLMDSHSAARDAGRWNSRLAPWDWQGNPCAVLSASPI